MLYYQTSKMVGNTPLLKWNNLYLKMENYNPSGSIKDRPACLMLDRLIRNGILKKDDTFICATSGNMGVSLAYYAKSFGLNVIITMPSNMTNERKKRIKALGAKLILTKSSEGMSGSIIKAKHLSQSKGYYYLDQFESKYNIISHYKTLKEIVEDLPDVDTIVASVGTGGTYLGITKMIGNLKLKTKVVGVEPTYTSTITSYLNNYPISIKSTDKIISGIGANFLPPLIKLYIKKDAVIKTIDASEIIDYWHSLLKQGLYVGPSSSSSIYVANQLLEKKPNSKIVVIIPDGYDRYLDDTIV